MGKFIKLTRCERRPHIGHIEYPYIINTDFIVAIEECNECDGAMIIIGRLNVISSCIVKETPEKIIDIIEDRKETSDKS